MFSLTTKALSPRNLQLALNAVCFYIGSLVAIIFGDIAALGLALLYAIIHVFFVHRNWREWVFLASVVVFGSAVDSLWSYVGLIDFNTGSVLAPLWLVCLWFFFASTLCHSLHWFRLYPWVSAACAAVAGPFSYFAGSELNQVELGQPLWRTLLIMSVYWAIVFPLLMRTSSWVNNVKQ